MLTNCPECTHPFSDTSAKCPHCGFQARRQRIIYMILGLTLGITGIHNFYIGRSKCIPVFLALLILSPFSHGFTLLISYLLIAVECINITKDGDGNPLV